MHQGEEDLDFAWISTLIEELGLTDIQSRVENDKPLANLGDDAIKLSGGQRQRLAIARALYLRPKLLILDEVTSFQDGKSELSILEFLKTVMRDMTTIIISHKPTTIGLSDFVYKISDKSVVELI
jgi:subfamily B ATP-binding cassette protein MsbA